MANCVIRCEATTGRLSVPDEEFNDEVSRCFTAAKELARRRGTTAGRMVSELLRTALTTPAGDSSRVAESEAFHGFRPFPPRGGIATDDPVELLRDQEGI